MRVVEPGHAYALANADDGGEQIIEFVRRRDAAGEPLPDAKRSGGLLCQEVLRVLIDRTLYLYAEAPCDEDTAIIEHLRAALAAFEVRAARRSIEKLSKPEEATICPRCQHIACLHPERYFTQQRTEGRRMSLKPGDRVTVKPEHDIPPVFRPDGKPTSGSIHEIDWLNCTAIVWVPIGGADVTEHSQSVPYPLGALILEG